MTAARAARNTAKQDSIWVKSTKPKDYSKPDYLWKTLWPRHNKTEVLVVSEAQFLGEAIAAAKHAKNRKKLDKILRERLRARLQHFEATLLQASYTMNDGTDKLQSDKDRLLADQLCRRRTVDSVDLFLVNCVLGKEADYQEERAPSSHDKVKRIEYKTTARTGSDHHVTENNNMARENNTATENTDLTKHPNHKPNASPTPSSAKPKKSRGVSKRRERAVPAQPSRRSARIANQRPRR